MFLITTPYFRFFLFTTPYFSFYPFPPYFADFTTNWTRKCRTRKHAYYTCIRPLLSKMSTDGPRFRKTTCRPAGDQLSHSSLTGADLCCWHKNRLDDTSSTPPSQCQDRKIPSPSLQTLPINFLTGDVDAHTAESLRAAKKQPAYSRLTGPQGFPSRVPHGNCRRLPTLPAKQSRKPGPNPWHAVPFLTFVFGLSPLLNGTVAVVQAQPGQQAARCRVSRPSKNTLVSQLWWPETTALDRILYR